MDQSRTSRLWQRRQRLAFLLCGSIVLIFGIAPVFAQDSYVKTAEPTVEQQELLQRRNDQLQQVQLLRKAGKLTEAIRGARRLDQTEQDTERLSPRHWAAFVLSGDWR